MQIKVLTCVKFNSALNAQKLTIIRNLYQELKRKLENFQSSFTKSTFYLLVEYTL